MLRILCPHGAGKPFLTSFRIWYLVVKSSGKIANQDKPQDKSETNFWQKSTTVILGNAHCLDLDLYTYDGTRFYWGLFLIELD